jgi:hypothetical protein
MVVFAADMVNSTMSTDGGIDPRLVAEFLFVINKEQE